MSSKEKKKDIAKNIPILPSCTNKMNARGQVAFTVKKLKTEKKKISSFDTFQVRQNYQTYPVGTNRDLPYQNKCSEPSHLVFP